MMDTPTLITLAVVIGNAAALLGGGKVIINQILRNQKDMLAEFKSQSEKDRDLYAKLIKEMKDQLIDKIESTEERAQTDHSRLLSMVANNERDHRQSHEKLTAALAALIAKVENLNRGMMA